MTPILHYGLHFAAGDVGFLIQRAGSQSIYGDLTSPFTLERPFNTRSCPHAIDLDNASPAGREIFTDPLATWFAEARGVALIQGVTVDLLAKLAELYTPTRTTIEFAWSQQRQRHWMQEASLTNLAPWILTDVDVKSVDKVRALASGAFPRPVLLLASQNIPMPSGSTRLSTDLTLADLEAINLERLGAWAVTKRLRRERITAR